MIGQWFGASFGRWFGYGEVTAGIQHVQSILFNAEFKNTDTEAVTKQFSLEKDLLGSISRQTEFSANAIEFHHVSSSDRKQHSASRNFDQIVRRKKCSTYSINRKR